ncbi:MAG: PHP domain-containing protein, partial [Bacilli bacterium]|nr:PHP domain-containing protein [Bacilli bacterium]
MVGSNLHAYPSFADACAKENIKAVFGYKITLASSETIPYRAYLFIKSEKGYQNLLKIIKEQKKVIGLNLLKEFHEGLSLIIQADHDLFYQDYFLTTISKDITQYQKLFQEDFAFGITLLSKEDQEDSSQFYQFCKERQYRILAFPEVRYLH